MSSDRLIDTLNLLNSHCSRHASFAELLTQCAHKNGAVVGGDAENHISSNPDQPGTPGTAAADPLAAKGSVASLIKPMPIVNVTQIQNPDSNI